MGLQIGIGNFAGIVASNIYRTKETPTYRLGRKSRNSFCKSGLHLTFPTDGVELGLVGMGFVVLPILVTTYNRINARREVIMRGTEESGGLQYTDEELRRMGDKAPDFRYGI